MIVMDAAPWKHSDTSTVVAGKASQELNRNSQGNRLPDTERYRFPAHTGTPCCRAGITYDTSTSRPWLWTRPCEPGFALVSKRYYLYFL